MLDFCVHNTATLYVDDTVLKQNASRIIDDLNTCPESVKKYFVDNK